MRKVMLSLLILCLLPGAFAADQSPEVKKLENGFYESDVLLSKSTDVSLRTDYSYIVDSPAGICYLSRLAITMGGSMDLQVVPCKSLKKRHEWANIITWE